MKTLYEYTVEEVTRFGFGPDDTGELDILCIIFVNCTEEVIMALVLE
jgi:hypothetical protein